MLTFRKAVILAASVLSIIYFLHTSHRTSRTTLNEPAEAPQTKADGITYPIPTGRPSKSTAPTADKPDPQVQQSEKQKPPTQQTLQDSASQPLREQLRYQFPYDRDDKFPAYIWQTWKYTPASGEFKDEWRPAEASWTEQHPGFVHEVVTDDVAANMVRHFYASVPEVVEAYNALPLPVLKADFFRYLILLARGGIYSDIDTTALKSTTEWLPAEFPRSTIGLIVGIEADPDRPDWAEWFSRRIQFCQWTIQAKPGHPILRDVVATITEDTLRMKKLGHLKNTKIDKSVVEFTGPAMWTDAVFRYFSNPEFYMMEKSGKNITWEHFAGIESAKKVGDVVVLPITSFSPGVQQMGAKEPEDSMAFVKHDFEGTWKPEVERIKPVISS